MDVRAGYKLTEVGCIPEDWEAVQIRHVCRLINGRGFKPHEWQTVGLPIIRIQNLNGSKDFNFFSGDYDPKIIVEHGQLLFAWSGSRGTSFGPHVWRGTRALLNYHTWKVVVNESAVTADFLLHALRQLTSYIESRAHGASALVHTQKWEMETFPIVIPTSLCEQRAIAAALSDVDALLDGLGQLIAKKRDLKQAAMQQLLTGQTRLSDFRGEWAVKRIGEIATPTSETNTSGENLPVLTCSKHLGFVDSLAFFKNQVFSKDLSTYRVIRRGEIGYPANHVEEGSIGLQDLYDVALVSPIYVVFRVSEAISSFFLHRLLKLDSYREQFKTATTSSVDRRGSLRWPAFSEITVCVPPLPEQTAIAAVLSDMEAELAVLEARWEKTRALKQGMMQELLTGKTRLV